MIIAPPMKAALVCCALIFFCACIHSPVRYPAGDYVVVETTPADTLENLAGKYLNDRDKAWMIAEFNKVSTLDAGQKIIIPLKSFNLGGLRPDGYQLVPVLCYASVTATGETVEGEGPTAFERHMEYLKKNHYNVISLSRFMEFLEYKAQIPERSVVLTLDDNSRAVLNEALPVLETYSFPATVFVETDDLGKEKGLTLEDLKLLKAKGLDIQFRTGWGVDKDIDTGKISLDQYFSIMKTKFETAKGTLSSVSDTACDYYALPPSGPNNLLIELLRKQGVKAALAENGQANPFYVDPYDIGRIPVSPEFSTEQFKEKLVVFRWLEMH